MQLHSLKQNKTKRDSARSMTSHQDDCDRGLWAARRKTLTSTDCTDDRECGVTDSDMPAGIRDSAVIMCCQGGLRNNLCSDVSKTRSFVLSSCILFISTIKSRLWLPNWKTGTHIFCDLSWVKFGNDFSSPDFKCFFSVLCYCQASENRTTVTSRTESPSRHKTPCLREAHTPTPLVQTYRLSATKETRS